MNTSKVDPRRAAMLRVYRILLALAEKTAGDKVRPATEKPASGEKLNAAQS